MIKILVIDDEEAILELVKRGLEKEGFAVDTLTSAKKVDVSKLRQYNLLILDVMMPDIDGFTFCKKIRDMFNAPILFLTAKTLEDEVLYGLGIGGDDYITKPFRIKELRARVKAHLRRESRENHDYLFSEDGNIKFDLSAKKLLVCEKEIPLTHSEYKICELLIQNRGHVFSREQIYERVFGFYGESADNTIVVHVKNIRVKLSEAGVNPIQTVCGIGYKWE